MMAGSAASAVALLLTPAGYKVQRGSRHTQRPRVRVQRWPPPCTARAQGGAHADEQEGGAIRDATIIARCAR